MLGSRPPRPQLPSKKIKMQNIEVAKLKKSLAEINDKVAKLTVAVEEAKPLYLR